jgi:LysM repeat protein
MGKMLCPIAPSKLQLKIKGQNKKLTLINEGEINILKNVGLTEVAFDLLLPNVKYPFATYKSNFQNAKYFLDELEKMMTARKPFQFIVTRTLPNGKLLFDTNMKVSLEDYTIKEDSKEGFDVVVSIKLKQFKEYGTKVCNVSNNKVSAQNQRTTESSPMPTTNKTYTVVKGDSLWAIAKKFYGNGSKYTIIYNANKDKIKNPNLIYVGQVLNIPGGQSVQNVQNESATSNGFSKVGSTITSALDKVTSVLGNLLGGTKK